MADDAEPEPREGTAERESRPMGSDVLASGPSSETLERGQVGSAASFRALTERLRSPPEQPQPDAPSSPESDEGPPGRTPVGEGRSAGATEPVHGPATQVESEPPASIESALAPKDAESEDAQAFLEVFLDDPSDETRATAPKVKEVPAAEAAAPSDQPAAVILPVPEESAEAVSNEDPGPNRTQEDPDPRSAETARILLDIMSMPSGASQPQERALAADTLLRLADRMPPDALTMLAERLSIMDAPPALIVRRLLASPRTKVAALLLEKCNAIADQDLIDLAPSMDDGKLRMVARRRHVSSALSDMLIRRGDPSVDLTLVRNPNAVLSYEAFSALADRAKTDTNLQAPLATRADTPAPIAFELFWHLPPELRRYVLSRFLTDSATMERILAIASETREASAGRTLRQFPDRQTRSSLIESIETGEPGAGNKLAGLAGVCEQCARRIIADPGGEPLMVAMKALGMPRADFGEAIIRWRASPDASLRRERDLDDLQALFDTLSFNKARMLLTYWDWEALRSGPYRRQAA